MTRAFSVKKQDAAIEIEYQRLKKVFAGIPAEKLAAADNLFQRAAFMTITLQILEKQVKSEGPVIDFKNGKQQMKVENPAQKSYNTMINRYTATYDKLFSLLPKGMDIVPPDPGKESDGFDDFVGNRGD